MKEALLYLLNARSEELKKELDINALVDYLYEAVETEIEYVKQLIKNLE